MESLHKKLWHDPVWSKVIAGVILAAGALISTYFLDWWPPIVEFITRSYQLLFTSASVPNWAMLILGILSLPVLLLLVSLAWLTVFPKKSSPISWRDYTTDIYFGLRWRWKYLDNGRIYNTHTFCPHCDFQIYAENTSSYSVIDRIGFKCDSCESYLGEFDESLDSLESKTKRFIQQKIRNNTWLVKSD